MFYVSEKILTSFRRIIYVLPKSSYKDGIMTELWPQNNLDSYLGIQVYQYFKFPIIIFFHQFSKVAIIWQ